MFCCVFCDMEDVSGVGEEVVDVVVVDGSGGGVDVGGGLAIDNESDGGGEVLDEVIDEVLGVVSAEEEGAGL